MKSRAPVNDNGAIVGTATYSGTNTTIAAGSHGVMLLPLSFVRETTPGSGNFQPIFHNGLDDEAVLPVFQTQSGIGRGGYITCSGLKATLSQNLSGSSTATMTVSLQNKAGTSDSGTLTETAAGSGIFSNSTITVMLTPTTQTTGDSTVDTLNVKVSDTTLSMVNQMLTLQESAASSKSFTTLADTAVVTLSAALSTTVVNTITLNVMTASFPFETTLTETAVNSRVFQDTAGTTVTVTNYTSSTGGSMNIAVIASFLPATGLIASLSELSSSLQYTNYQKNTGNVTVQTPATNGQGIFYVQFPGAASTDITLVSGANQVTVSATPVTGKPGLLRTGKLVLIQPGDPFSASGITTLAIDPPSDGTNPSVQLKMYGQTIIDPSAAPGDAYLCAFHPTPDGLSVFGGNISVGTHLANVQKLLTVGGYSNPGTLVGTIVSDGLGWTDAPYNTAPTKSQILNEIPYHYIFYYFGFGASATKDVPPLTGINCWPDSGATNSAGKPLPYDTIHPDEVAAANMTANGHPRHYILVFLNACLTADRQTGTAAAGFLDAFKAEAYVGWTGPQLDQNDVADGEQFLAYLAKKDATVASALTAANGTPATRNDTLDNSLLAFLGKGKTKLLTKEPTP